jgi:hypothetical protein
MSSNPAHSTNPCDKRPRRYPSPATQLHWQGGLHLEDALPGWHRPSGLRSSGLHCPIGSPRAKTQGQPDPLPWRTGPARPDTTQYVYLCRGSADSDDMFFAPELPGGYFSPGLFLVEARNSRGKLDDVYGFTARHGEQEIALEINRTENGRSYVVDADQYGKCYFKVVAMSGSTKCGGLLVDNFEGFGLSRLEPVNIQRLEQVCRQQDFYCIGSSGNSAGLERCSILATDISQFPCSAARRTAMARSVPGVETPCCGDARC